MTCNNCGGDMIGDGVTVVLHCEHTEPSGLAPDAQPVHCKPTRIVTYSVSVTVTRPVRLYDYDDTLSETEAWMVTADARLQLAKELMQAMRTLDGDCDVDVLEALASDEDASR